MVFLLSLLHVLYVCIIHIFCVMGLSLDPGQLFFSCLGFYLIVNPRRACAARVTVVGLSVCLSVCVSVDAYSGTTGRGP